MTCFVDTSALLAVMDKDDEFHIEARALWERLTEQQAALVATNYVVLETPSPSCNTESGWRRCGDSTPDIFARSDD